MNLTDDHETVNRLQDELQIDPILAGLLVKRGIGSFEEARLFFRPELSHLHDPFLMKDMDRAIERIQAAISRQEKILVYGDYDVDGTTAVSLVYSYFRKIHPCIEFYIPDRYLEGYGISFKGIDYAAEHDYSLIIALDCGIKSNDKVDYAAERGIDFIICDHHLPGDMIPAAVAVLDPKRADCEYPYKELSGCGIGFKLIQAYAQATGSDMEEVLCYLDLVAVSIASDIVPITGENRVLAYHGLKKINEKPCTGIKAMISGSGRSNELGISDLVFLIGPRINAAGRMDDAKHAVKLLICDDETDARTKSELINTHNTDRKEADLNITQQALAMIGADEILVNRKTTVVYNPSWHKGVIGIVASRLTEKYYRPTIVLTQSNGHIAGSARSVTGFDLYEALSACSEVLEQFGGHKYAAGLTLKAENMEAFSNLFEKVVADRIPEELLIRQLLIDAELDLGTITPKFQRILNQFGPFGPHNMTPVFKSKNVYTYGQPRIVGSNHLKFTVQQNGSLPFECIGFGLAEDHLKDISANKAYDICYTLEENTWNDRKSIQLNIKAIRPQE